MIFFFVDSLHLGFGKHGFRFNIYLPQELPSTFSHDSDNVEYEAIVTIVMPWGINKTMKRSFEVVTVPIHLNNQLSLEVRI